MRIRNFLHRGLRRLYSEDSGRDFPPDAAARLREMMTFLQIMQDPAEFTRFPSWRVHQLTGNRAGTWSFRVTRNFRLTFRIEDGEVQDVNYEDYH
ncbi:MAG: plasmid maintenance system killer [Acidobacteria bacterium]|nr:plasmid maintenance system killer [Acidobacteriota bacterium]